MVLPDNKSGGVFWRAGCHMKKPHEPASTGRG
jgi:hypothetical protein